jgi:opacity protein-like surface antigen
MFKMKQVAMGAVAALALAGSAQAAVIVSASPTDMPLPSDHVLVWDFDGLEAVGYNLTLAGAAGVFDGSLGLVPNIAAPPPGTTSNYLAIQQGGSATLDTPKALKQLSIYMGSPDSFNSIRFIGLNGFDVTLTGADLAAGAFGGNQSVGRRMTYDFGADRVTQVIFSSSGNSFEFDNISVSAVPEPATWGLMIAGFGLLGGALRQRRNATAAFA